MERQETIEAIMALVVEQTTGGIAFQIEDEGLRQHIMQRVMVHVGPVLEIALSLLSTSELEEYHSFMTSETVNKMNRYLQSEEVRASLRAAMIQLRKEMA